MESKGKTINKTHRQLNAAGVVRSNSLQTLNQREAILLMNNFSRVLSAQTRRFRSAGLLVMGYYKYRIILNLPLAKTKPFRDEMKGDKLRSMI